MMYIAGLLIPMALAATFTDVRSDAWYAPYVHEASELGIVSGYKDHAGNSLGRFGPADPVTLAESLKIAVNGAGYDYQQYPALEWETDINHWIAPYYRIAVAEQFAYFVGAGEDLDAKATRIDVVSVIADAFLPEQRVTLSNTDVTTSYVDLDEVTRRNWGALIMKLTQDGIITGDTDAAGKPTGYFRPRDSINRAEMVKIMMKARAVYGTLGAR